MPRGKKKLLVQRATHKQASFFQDWAGEEAQGRWKLGGGTWRWWWEAKFRLACLGLGLMLGDGRGRGIGGCGRDGMRGEKCVHLNLFGVLTATATVNDATSVQYRPSSPPTQRRHYHRRASVQSDMLSS